MTRGWNGKSNSRPMAGLAATALAWSQALKVARCLPMAATAGFGFIAQRPQLDAALGIVVGGVLFLACGCAGINSVQEARIDRLYRRTWARPLATGQIRPGPALAVSAMLATGGLAVLAGYGWSNGLPLSLGLAALILYNGLYTPLKQVTVFALIPGGVAGSLPPLIGWTAAGGGLAEPRIWLLFSLFFLWQIPHFCLILLCHADDYRAVERPSLIRLFPAPRLRRIALVWIAALAVTALTLALDDLLQPASRLALAGMALFLTLIPGQRLLGGRADDARLSLWLLNAGFFLTLLAVTVAQLWPTG
ncbi:MAG: UbiA family prenyltransferase [Desulfobulbus sp.]|uniref:UbiA family prenyltransferase n=1 Tax=Desulfobulbus sp. TaxID=895 RepID=UPI002844DD6F|nr:UbiA family prenyltransferase [Desulfobulbus sp.]MDR2549293.1 UbiA family prenyltransferase [Desulfobulbus sp.]